MFGMHGLQFLEHTLHHDPGVYAILMTGFYSLDNAIAAIKSGVYDNVSKAVARSRLKRSLDDLSDWFDRRKGICNLEHPLLNDLEFHGIVGRSPAMIEVFEMVRKMPRHYTNILQIGATGVGKELLAKFIHKISPVAQVRFAVCNCSAMVETLLESISATCAGPSRTRLIRARGCSNARTAEPSSSTKLERHRWWCSQCYV
jgi:two-component system response regulator HydG